MSNTIQTGFDGGSTAVDTFAHSADEAIRGTQRLGNHALDQMAGQVESVRAQAGPALDGLAQQAAGLAQRGSDAIRHRSEQLRDQAFHARDATRGYIEHEPMKAMLLGAATGALLVALGTLLSHRGHR
jgi:ElaB/YqjD/DUF883 family membrane-anchored ribosome-binding protein